MNEPEHLGRLRRIEGQVCGLQRVIDRDGDFVDVFAQVAAVNRALQSVRAALRQGEATGGDRPRVANNPPVILADEPTANLDSAIGRQVARLRQLATQDHRAVVIVSHDTRLEQIADRVLWLEDGTFRELATMATDPVCGMTVSQHDQPHLQRDGTVWWFCSIACRDEFAADPARFRDRPLARDASAATRPRP
jgi:YHS domain-containing protein